MNEFLKNTDRFFYDILKMNNKLYIRESNNKVIKWFDVETEYIISEDNEIFTKLENQYLRSQKLERILNDTNKDNI
jgi:hypothetical protein